MRVTRDDHGDACRVRMQIKLRKRVEHVEELAVYFEDLGCGEIGARTGSVDVTADRVHCSQRPQAVQDSGVAHIAGVQDKLHSTERLENAGPKQAVCVGENAEEHDLRMRPARCGTSRRR